MVRGRYLEVRRWDRISTTIFRRRQGGNDEDGDVGDREPSGFIGINWIAVSLVLIRGKSRRFLVKHPRLRRRHNTKVINHLATLKSKGTRDVIVRKDSLFWTFNCTKYYPNIPIRFIQVISGLTHYMKPQSGADLQAQIVFCVFPATVTDPNDGNVSYDNSWQRSA